MQYINSFFFRLATFLAIMNFPFSTMAQVTFQKTYSTTYDKTTHDVLATPDGGYILVGMTNNSNITDCDLLIMKTDGNGELLWTKTYGGSKPDYAYSLVETNDGNYFVTGFSQSFSAGGDYDIYLIKFDLSGNKIWEKTYGSWGNEEGKEIIKTSDGNYILVGTSTSFSSSQDMVLIKIDIAGTVLWTKTYGGSNKESGNSVKLCQDGGFILGGQTLSWGQNGDSYIVRTNSNGDTLWTNYYGSPLADEAVSVFANNDGSFVFAIRDSTANSDINVRVIKTDGNGGVSWNKMYGASQKDTPKSICSTMDGGYFIGAISRSFGWINPDMWLLKMDAAGDTTWTRHFGSSEHEHCHVAKQSADGGYLAAGHARSFGPGQKVFFLKLNNSGVVSVQDRTSTNSDLEIYPNPSSTNTIHIRCRSNETSYVKIQNTVGQLMYYSKIMSEVDIDLSQNAPGVYIVIVENENGKAVRKLVLGE